MWVLLESADSLDIVDHMASIALATIVENRRGGVSRRGLIGGHCSGPPGLGGQWNWRSECTQGLLWRSRKLAIE